MKIVCRLCLVLAAAWCIRAALVPVWIGRFRSPLHAGATGWVQAGVFALKDGRGVRASAPLWDPPPPHAENIPATARWPWQAVTRCEHVEIDLSALVRDWVCALITLGAVLAGAKFVLDRRTPHGCVTVCWSLTLTLGAASLGLLGLVLVTHGYAPIETFDVSVFTVAAVVGVVVGVVRHRRACAMAARQADIHPA